MLTLRLLNLVLQRTTAVSHLRKFGYTAFVDVDYITYSFDLFLVRNEISFHVNTCSCVTRLYIYLHCIFLIDELLMKGPRTHTHT